MDEASKQYTAFTTGSLGCCECQCMPFRQCNAPTTFQRLMQNCLGELSLTYCLIYLDDVIVFSKMEEEHLKPLHIMFNCFWEHNLRLKSTKGEFFREYINYLAHPVCKGDVWPSKENLKAVAQFAQPLTYTEIQTSLGLVGHYRQLNKGFAHIVQPLREHLSWEGACKKGEWVTLMAEAKDTFETLKKACLEAHVLAFSDFDKPCLLETEASKLRLGAVLSQKQADGQLPFSSICQPIPNYQWA